jgi:hypothetical protein
MSNDKEREADALIRRMRDVLDESRSYIGAPTFSPSMDGEAAVAVELADQYLAARASLAASAGSEPVAPGWWRTRADEIELQVARTGSSEAMRCYTDMRALLQAAANPPKPKATKESEPVAWRHNRTLCLYDTQEEVPLADGDEWAEPLYLEPNANIGMVAGGSWDHLKLMMEHSAFAGELQLDDALANIDEFAGLHPSPPEGMVGGWRPIETAPKGGEFLVWGKYFAYAFLVSVRQEKFVTAGKVVITSATHWMPLPAPPLAAGGGREADHG